MNCFWKHKWNNWVKIEEGEITRADFHSYEIGARRVIGRYLCQQRTCKKCGKYEINKQEVRL